MSGHTPPVADVLDAAADLLTPEGAWTQGAYARDMFGGNANPYEEWIAVPDATCWCMWGAVAHAANSIGAERVHSLLRFDLPDTEWNDDPKRTQSEVVAALREAANAARVTSKEASHES